jgi:hypothetical protein
MHLENVELVRDSRFHRQGGFADVYRGILDGQLVAIKKPRSVDDAEIAQKVVLLSHDRNRIFSSHLSETVSRGIGLASAPTSKHPPISWS